MTRPSRTLSPLLVVCTQCSPGVWTEETLEGVLWVGNDLRTRVEQYWGFPHTTRQTPHKAGPLQHNGITLVRDVI